MLRIKQFLSLIKFSHTVFALPFAMIGFCLGVCDTRNNKSNEEIITSANSCETISLLSLIILCMIFARSAAMAFNRYLDADIDAKNIRTAKREIPAGVISKKHALKMVIASSCFFISTTFLINWLCFYLSFVALFVILFYSYTKRFTPMCHLVLGVGLSLAPIGAYIAITQEFKLLPLLFSSVVFTWVSGFDIIYALQDETFDRENNLKSIPVLLGSKNALFFSRILHAICAGIILWIGIEFLQSPIYFTGAVLFTALLFFQHLLVKPNDLSKVNVAFATTNGWASILFGIFTCTSILLN